MENIQSLMANLTDAEVAEYQTAKYPASVQDWARQEAEARVTRRQLAQDAIANQIAVEQAKVVRGAMIAKIAKGLEKVWTNDLTNVLIFREEVDDTEHGEAVYFRDDKIVATQEESNREEIRYPKVMELTVKTNVHWSENKQGIVTKSKSDTTTKRGITVSKRTGNQLELIGHFRSANEICDYKGIVVGKDSAMRVLQREGYFIEPYIGTDFTVAK